MKKCCIIGAFGFSDLEHATGGQPVKTRALYDLLEEKYGDERITYIETYQWKKNPIRMLVQLLLSVFSCDVLIMLPAQNGVRVFTRILRKWKRKDARLYYDVIGGWLPEKLLDDHFLLAELKKFDGIWVETYSMEKVLKELGLKNVSIVPNFKRLEILSKEELPDFTKEPLPLCTFSRVMEEKGISEAIEVVTKINAKLGRKVFTLDIFGPVAPEYELKFYDKLKHCSGEVSYKGVVLPEKSVQTVKNYFAMLFPTYYAGEGFAGTLLDAMAAGVPVIASDWKYNRDIVRNGKTGVLFRAKDMQDMEEKLMFSYQNLMSWNGMRVACIEEAKRYTSEVVLKQITECLEGDFP